MQATNVNKILTVFNPEVKYLLYSIILNEFIQNIIPDLYKDLNDINNNNNNNQEFEVIFKSKVIAFNKTLEILALILEDTIKSIENYLIVYKRIYKNNYSQINDLNDYEKIINELEEDLLVISYIINQSVIKGNYPKAISLAYKYLDKELHSYNTSDFIELLNKINNKSNEIDFNKSNINTYEIIQKVIHLAKINDDVITPSNYNSFINQGINTNFLSFLFILSMIESDKIINEEIYKIYNNNENLASKVSEDLHILFFINNLHLIIELISGRNIINIDNLKNLYDDLSYKYGLKSLERISKVQELFIEKFYTDVLYLSLIDLMYNNQYFVF